MHPLLEKHLGKTLTAAEVAEYFGCSLITVYRNYISLGGVRIGTSYKFFEKRIIHAVLGQNKEKMDRSGQVQKEKVSVFPAQQNKSETVGSKKAVTAPERGTDKLADPHGLLA